MANISPLNGKDLSYRSYLSQTKKVGGKIIQEELHIEPFDGEDGLDSLLEGIDTDEVEEGFERLYSENPQMVSQNMHDFLDNAVADEDIGTEFNSPKRMAGVKRAGKLVDANGDSVSFRRKLATREVEILSEDGAVIETFSNKEFDELLDDGEYEVL